MEVWGFGGLGVWGFGGLKVWGFGGLEVWGFGGLEFGGFGGLGFGLRLGRDPKLLKPELLKPLKHPQTLRSNTKLQTWKHIPDYSKP